MCAKSFILITHNGNRYENGFLRIDNMEELEKIITAMLDHIDEHKDAYNKPQWSNKLIVRAWLKTHQEQVKNCLISGVVISEAELLCSCGKPSKSPLCFDCFCKGLERDGAK